MKRRLLTSSVILFMTFTFFGIVLSYYPIMIYAVTSGVNISGKIYEFDEKSHYEFSSTEEYTSTADEGKTYGKLSINANITDITEINGIASYGYDNYFETSVTNFGRGALIIRYTDYENVQHDPITYTNYLNANAKTGADTIVQLFEEGDYEVALNYKIKNNKTKVLGQSILPEYNDYRIFFKFSVRNGNCMVYPFDVATKAELTNSSITENGFYLNLAKSRYLDINIKKEVLKEGTEGVTEDIRFNKPAKDGDQYTEEGIEVHHIIPKAISDDLVNDGFAIKISKAKHRSLASTGSSKEAIAFRAEIKKLFDAGKFKEAYTMGFDDIIAKTGDKYLAEIIELKKMTGLF